MQVIFIMFLIVTMVSVTLLLLILYKMDVRDNSLNFLTKEEIELNFDLNNKYDLNKYRYALVNSIINKLPENFLFTNRNIMNMVSEETLKIVGHKNQIKVIWRITEKLIKEEYLVKVKIKNRNFYKINHNI